MTSLNLSSSEFPFMQGLRTREVSQLLRMVARVERSSGEIRQTLKEHKILEIPADQGQGTFVVEFAHPAKHNGRYRCDVSFRPSGFAA